MLAGHPADANGYSHPSPQHLVKPSPLGAPPVTPRIPAIHTPVGTAPMGASPYPVDVQAVDRSSYKEEKRNRKKKLKKEPRD